MGNANWLDDYTALSRGTDVTGQIDTRKSNAMWAVAMKQSDEDAGTRTRTETRHGTTTRAGMGTQSETKT